MFGKKRPNPSYTISLSEDEAIVLMEFSARWEQSEGLDFKIEHAAEYVAFTALLGRIDCTSSAIFKPNWDELLAGARKRVAGDYEGDVPGLGFVKS